jgi:hypothetical protein
MDMVKRAALFTLLVSSMASAQGLSLTIGSSVATGNYQMKSIGFAFRMNNCVDPASAQVTVTAEVAGHSSPLPVTPVQNQPGAYGVPSQSEAADWVAAITATCKGETVGALVPFTGRNFKREGIQMLPHAPTRTEIDTALKNLPRSSATPQ